ncbi:RlpA-like double-psi beta-barrel-protein domain-containing protein-containing protein [Xylariales sp. PMI_506]|nr:RlpA-like double-psi beta-barrel-protein domain-containing protein-containing protein [Xylariales sp. PMI_506]
MSDEHLSPAAPATVYQTPDWETPSRGPRRSPWSRFAPTGMGSGLSGTRLGFGAKANDNAAAVAKEEPDQEHELTVPAVQTMQQQQEQQQQQQQQPVGGAGFPASMRRRLDAALPPNRTYFGRSRRFLLLFVLLPLAVLLFIILPLAIGLGVGLSHRGKGSEDLPLPSNTNIFTGDLTYYAPGLGACGETSSSSDDICAVSHLVFDAASTGSNPNANPLCGKKIRITRDFVETGVGNRSVDVTVVDRCVGCAATDLDVTISVFTELALEAEGRVTMSWAWLN